LQPRSAQPQLRLVGRDDHLDQANWQPMQQARQEVMKENRLAAHAGLDPQDPRWVLAMQTEARLQGVTLTPERREELLHRGKKLGLRPFESNLVIAIVQDRARANSSLERTKPLLNLVGGAEKDQAARSSSAPAWPKWLLAIAAALAAATLVVRWLVVG
jgi:hypothetical protein